LVEILRLSTLENKYFNYELNIDHKYISETYQNWSVSKFDNALDLADGDIAEAFRIFDLLYNTLSDNYLVKVDRSSMAHSIEVRSPFLDYRLANFSQEIPSNFKVGLTSDKILMRKIIKDIIPLSILKRSKMGFTPPLSDWINTVFTKDCFLNYLNYLPNNQLKIHFNKVYENVDFKSRDFELIKLFIYGNWYNYWINGISLSN
jgi:asparagine synthase (glutamine-hydrolysing)